DGIRRAWCTDDLRGNLGGNGQECGVVGIRFKGIGSAKESGTRVCAHRAGGDTRDGRIRSRGIVYPAAARGGPDRSQACSAGYGGSDLFWIWKHRTATRGDSPAISVAEGSRVDNGSDRGEGRREPDAVWIGRVCIGLRDLFGSPGY